MPGPNRLGVKIVLPSVRRICVFSIVSVPGCSCEFSVLLVKWTPMRVARSWTFSKTPKAPMGQNCLVVGSQLSISE